MDASTLVTERITKYLDAFDTAAANGVDLLQKEIPLYVQEMLSWIFVENLVHAITLVLVAVVLLIIGYFTTKYAIKKTAEDGDNPWPLLHIVLVIGVVVSCINFCDATHYAMKAAKVKIAPRVVIVEEINKLTK